MQHILNPLVRRFSDVEHAQNRDCQKPDVEPDEVEFDPFFSVQYSVQLMDKISAQFFVATIGLEFRKDECLLGGFYKLGERTVVFVEIEVILTKNNRPAVVDNSDVVLVINGDVAVA